MDLYSLQQWLGHGHTQDQRRHVHVHALMACGALGRDADDAARWLEPKRWTRFLFPVHALSEVFNGKFLDALQHAEDGGTLARDPVADPAQRGRRRRALRGHAWVVYAKTPLAGPAAVLDDLSRYPHRTAVGSERIVAMRDKQVLLRVRPDEHGAGAA